MMILRYSLSCVESTASVVAKRWLSRGDSVPDPVELSGGRGPASRHHHRAAVHGPIPQRVLPQGEAEGSHDGIEGRADSQDLGELQQFRAELSVPVLRVR